MERKVIVVGNAPIKGMGAVIDSYDIVCRMKHYAYKSLEDYKDDVGTKTDICFDGYFLRKKYPASVKFLPFNISIKEKRSREAGTYIRAGIVAIFQALEMFGPPITFIGFNFDNFKNKSGYCRPALYSYDEIKDDPKYHKINNVIAKMERWSLPTYEEPAAEGRLVQKYIDKGDILWLQ